MQKLKISNGEKYNRLTIIKETEQRGYNRYFKCKCDCGNEKIIKGYSIRSGNSRSCGCIIKEMNKKSPRNKQHGFTGTKIYNVWFGIKQRCNYENHNRYKNYGGRGISYEWSSFEDFYKDMGDSYKEGLTIDRIDNNGNYSKSNCRWITNAEQQRNKRNNIKYKGKCVAEWARELGINKFKIYSRIKRGSSLKKALCF